MPLVSFTIRRAYDTFREQVVVVIIEWLLDLTRSRLGADTLIIRTVIAAELLSSKRRESSIYGPPSHLNDLSDEMSNPCRDRLDVFISRPTLEEAAHQPERDICICPHTIPPSQTRHRFDIFQSIIVFFAAKVDP